MVALLLKSGAPLTKSPMYQSNSYLFEASPGTKAVNEPAVGSVQSVMLATTFPSTVGKVASSPTVKVTTD